MTNKHVRASNCTQRRQASGEGLTKIVLGRESKHVSSGESRRRFTSQNPTLVKMPLKCCVSGCSNRYVKENKTYSFHRFPSVKSEFKLHRQSVLLAKRRAAWIKAINRKSLVISHNCYVCSLHFRGGKLYLAINEGLLLVANEGVLHFWLTLFM